MTPPAKSHAQHGWLTFILLALLQASVVWAVQQAGWLLHGEVLTWVSLGAILTALALSKLRVPEEVVHLLSLFIGVGALGYAGAATLSKGNLYERVVVILERFARWLEVTRSGGIGTDGLLFLLFLAAIAWLVGYVGAWAVYRHHNAWFMTIGTGTALVVAISYAENLSHFFFLYAPTAVLLFVHVHGLRREQSWRRAGVVHAAEMRFRFLRQGLLAAAALVLVSIWAPSIAGGPEFVRVWQKFERPWLEVQAEFARLFGPVQVGAGAGSSSYGPTLALQGGVNLADSEVMEVRTTNPRRLRGVVYDRYTGQGWIMEDRQQVEIPAAGDGMVAASADMERREIEQTIRVLRTKGDLLFAASLPRAASIPVRAELETRPAGQGGRASSVVYTDLGAVRAVVGPYRGQEYTVVSAVSKASAESLRAAATDYPQSIWRGYTALPRSVPMRVRALAASLTRGKANPYEKALAIESYLRGLTYTLHPPAPPTNRDVVDFFLFESREGYCDYYSSAMVVMLRAVGIPARVVAGYLPGDWDAGREAYVVRESHSHSWPEVYFPGYGWIEFEPTAYAPQVSRPETIAEAAQLESETPTASDSLLSVEPEMAADDANPTDEAGDLGEEAGPGDRAAPGFALPTIPTEVVVALLIVLVAGLGAARAIAFLWERHFAGLVPEAAAYDKMSHLARWLGHGRRPQQTPLEYAEALARVVPGGAAAIRLIALSYSRYRFGRAHGDCVEGETAARAWHEVRRELPRGVLGWTAQRLTRRWPARRG